VQGGSDRDNRDAAKRGKDVRRQAVSTAGNAVRCSRMPPPERLKLCGFLQKCSKN
jgi:hypothetical protein